MKGMGRMNRKLLTIAKQLSGNDLEELLRLRKMEEKKVSDLHKTRDKLVADLAKVEKQLAKLDSGAESAPKTRKKRGRKPASEAKAETAPARKAGKKKAGAKKGAKKRSRRLNLSAAVREVFARAARPLKASEVVDGLPAAGIKIADVSAMRKRISVVLASQKNHFEQVERGVYQLKD